MKIEQAQSLSYGDTVRFPSDMGLPAGRDRVTFVGDNVYKNIHGVEYVWVSVKGHGVWPSHRLEPEMVMTNEEIAAVTWKHLSEVVVDNDGNIEQPWRHFEAGTDREEIWKWFEDTFDVSVYQMMYGKSHLLREIAEKNDIPFTDTELRSVDAEDLTGFPSNNT